jgi:hypothetical protein
VSKTLELSFDIYSKQDEEDLKRCISDVIKENENSFMPRIAKVCSQYDMRADVSEDSLAVEDVMLSEERAGVVEGTVSVTYCWSSYYGCKDMCGADTVNDTWDFSVTSNKLLINLSIPEDRVDEI